MPKLFQPKTSNILDVCFLAGLCHGHYRYFAKLHDSPLRGEPIQPRVLSLNGFSYDYIEAMSDTVIF